MLDAIRQSCQNYYDDIPPDTLPTMAKSAIFSFSWTILFNRVPRQPWDITRPLFHAGVAALATLIYSLTTPIFNKIFGDNQILLHREIMKSFVDFSVTTIIISYLTTSKVDLTALPFIKMLSFNILRALYDLDTAYAAWVDPRFGNFLSQVGNYTGLSAVPGSASIHLSSPRLIFTKACLLLNLYLEVVC